MKNYRMYKVSAELKPFIRRILVRSFASCQMMKDSGGHGGAGLMHHLTHSTRLFSGLSAKKNQKKMA